VLKTTRHSCFLAAPLLAEKEEEEEEEEEENDDFKCGKQMLLVSNTSCTICCGRMTKEEVAT